MVKRVRITSTGKKIQKAGYRERVIEIAENLDIVGTVWNAPDGSVEIVGEGDEKSLEEFVKLVKIQEKETESPLLRIFVEETSVVMEDATGEYKMFDVRYEDEMEVLRDLKSDFWAAKRIMKDMSSYQQKTSEGVGELTIHTDKNFSRMEGKYHRISVLSVALLATISSFAVYGVLVFLNAIPRTLEWFMPWFGFNVIVWVTSAYFVIRKNKLPSGSLGDQD